MAPPIFELVHKTAQPFVTKIQDIASTKATFMGGKMVLVGDALCAYRPHIALSSNQAAKHCLMLDELFEGGLEIQQWEREVLRYAQRVRMLSVVLGTYGQDRGLGFVWNVVKYVGIVFGQMVGIL
jgi:hypothetical protein